MIDEELKLFKEKEEPEFRIKETGEKISLEKIKKIILIYQERLKKLSEISELVDFFFKKKLVFEKELLRWKDMKDKEIKASLDRSMKILHKIKEEDWNKEEIARVLIKEAEKFAKEIKKEGDRGYLLWPLRVALTGKKASAPPFEIAEILGKEKTIQRIKEARNLL